MRVNVYAEELTEKTEIVIKEANGHEFYGIRLYLKSHPDLHHTTTDNDDSAVTIWIPFTKEHGNDFDFVISILRDMAEKLAIVYKNT